MILKISKKQLLPAIKEILEEEVKKVAPNKTVKKLIWTSDGISIIIKDED